jgi:hypothetical protein
MSKGIVYYTDNRPDPKILNACRKQIDKSGLETVCVSLGLTTWGDKRIVLIAERGYLTMFRQILTGLEQSSADVIFFCEHDVLYHPSHFEYTPEHSDVYYYNENVYKVKHPEGKAVFYYCKQTSGLCAYRELLLEHYQKRVERVSVEGYTRAMGFEPGTHYRKERVDNYTSAAWMSASPNIDIRHKKNLTPSRWSVDQFRNKKFTEGWQEVKNVPYWGNVSDGGIVDILDKV